MDNSCPFKNKIITKAVAPPLFFILLIPFWFWLFSCSSSSVFLTSAGKQDFDELISARTWEKNSEINASSIPKIKIISKDWGNGHPKDIHEILKSVAEILFPLGGKKPYDPVWVGKSENGPIILYQRGKKGEYIINLNTQDRYWCQYAFQFGHEVATSFVITGREILPTCGSKKHFVKLPHFIHFYGWKKSGNTTRLTPNGKTMARNLPNMHSRE